MIIVDSHQDLAWNILTFGRDYTRSVEQTRSLESRGQTPAYNGDTLLGWPEYQLGQVAVIFATLFAAPIRHKLGDWDTLTYSDADRAHSIYMAQIDAYHRLADEHSEKFRLVQTLQDLNEVINAWEQDQEEGSPVGLVILMEGAEGVREPAELEAWWEKGVRLIGPAWAGTRFCGGTREPGPLTAQGYALLEGMAQFGFVLDLTHMDEEAVLQALDIYPRSIVATHSNPHALLKNADLNRFLSDRVLQGLIDRQGVVGIPPYNKFLRWEWTSNEGREAISLELVVDHIDYICQMAGNAKHVGIGTDFDGGFGYQSVPHEINSIADLQKIIPLLEKRGYTESDISAIMSENWLSLLKENLPKSA
ncbi:MAG: membrane dipeptidase [Chloroflexota bacterium]|nr:MAG: membrane dipeptidase [Chloroflexota bacterium]